eukprot:4390667-Lingulodinium_polyedra.AAC.1
MPRAGDMEPAYPLAVEPACDHGAVDIGWPGHLAMLLPDVSTQVPEGHTYVTTFYPTCARASVVEHEMAILQQKRCGSTLRQSRLP